MSAAASLFALCAAFAPVTGCVADDQSSDRFAVPVVDLGRSERDLRFPAAHRLPRPDDTLLARLERALASRFDAPARGAEPEDGARAATGTEAGESAWTRSFGDLVQAFGAVRRDARRTDALLARLRAERPRAYDAVGELLAPLVRTAGLYRADWDPETEAADDGFLAGDAYALDRRRAPWRELSGDGDVQQVALLVWADEAALKQAESDYTTYKARPHTTLEEIGVVRDSWVTGRDARGPWNLYVLRSRSDLPWPFSDYTADVATLLERDAEGRLVTHVWSSSDDFLWLAGRDTYVPVTNADGALVATLVVRELGFDLDGVPDGDSDRRTAMRTALGCLKRDAERRIDERFAAAHAAARDEATRAWARSSSGSGAAGVAPEPGAAAGDLGDIDESVLAERAPGPGDALPDFVLRSPR
ncbi:MAG: hypothetical protein H6825_06645 [Planctomycetes bacterium]|nr:hypothetical protein [Planctomycetota bacterium]